MGSYKKGLMKLLEGLEAGQRVALEHEEDSYFDGWAHVHDCTLTVLQSIDGKYETVEEYQIALDWDTIVEFHNGEE